MLKLSLFYRGLPGYLANKLTWAEYKAEMGKAA
jgi:hypothetical protein